VVGTAWDLDDAGEQVLNAPERPVVSHRRKASADSPGFRLPRNLGVLLSGCASVHFPWRERVVVRQSSVDSHVLDAVRGATLDVAVLRTKLLTPSLVRSL
jgi:hypothetical protein